MGGFVHISHTIFEWMNCSEHSFWQTLDWYNTSTCFLIYLFEWKLDTCPKHKQYCSRSISHILDCKLYQFWNRARHYVKITQLWVRKLINCWQSSWLFLFALLMINGVFEWLFVGIEKSICIQMELWCAIPVYLYSAHHQSATAGHSGNFQQHSVLTDALTA